MNKKNIIILFVIVFQCWTNHVYCQQLPTNPIPITLHCGLLYSYDAAGNRIQRGPLSCRHHEMADVSDTAVADSQMIKEKLFPNPTSGSLTIEFSAPVNDAQISVMDNLGRQLYITNVSGISIPLDISRYANGLYFIVVRTQGKSYESTVVKE